MPTKHIVLAIMIATLLLVWSALAEIEWVWSFFLPLASGTQEYALLSSGEVHIDSDDGQIMTAVDNVSGFPSSPLSSQWDEEQRAWVNGNDTYQVGNDEVNYDMNGEEELLTGQTIPDPLPDLILSEVYYDGTDEWIEITNIGEGNFEGNIVLSWVKSTTVSLTNISLLAGASKVFGDTLAQISWTSFVGKTGLGFSMTDTAAIAIHLLVSGQREDSLLVDQYWVNKYNDKKTSFEKLAGIPTRVHSDRVAQAQSGYTINPGIYFATGVITSNVSFPPEQSWAHLQVPISCDSLDQRDLIKIKEIFPWNEKYPAYIELAVHENISLDSLSISGNLLATGITFSFDSWATTLQNNSLLLLSATGFWQSEGIASVRNSDFSLLSTWNWLLITIGSWQSRQLLDIVYLSGNTLGTSSYFWSNRVQCARNMDDLDEFSPGFEKRFLKYFPVTTITKIEYIEIPSGAPAETGSCQVPWPTVPFSWDIPISIEDSKILHEYTIRILDIDYDPKGADTNNEKITLLATHISGDQTPLDLSKVFRLKVNGTNKTLPRILPMDIPTTFTKTFGFPNTTKSWAAVHVALQYGEHIFDTYTYTPKTLSAEDEKALTSTGYTVSSVLDGDTLRIKYQGKTQSVRLLGIDAPESTKTRYKHLECFGIEAKNYLKALVDKKKITLQFDTSQDQKDLYDRLLAYVFLDDKNINQTMIEDGYAKEYTYKTPYSYQSQFKQAEQSAQEQEKWLWNQATCGVSLSGIVLTGDLEASGTLLNLSWLQFTIRYVLPNPKWADTAEELGLMINYGNRDEEQVPITTLQVASLAVQSTNIGSQSASTEDHVLSTGQRVPITQIDLSQWFSLRIGKTKKKIEKIVYVGQENILSWSLWLVNKASCVSLFYGEEELSKFCYGQPKEGQKIYASYQWLAETPQENLDILNALQLKRIGNRLCIWYKGQSFLCKRIPASKAEIKATQEQKMYKWFASLLKQYILSNWKGLYYSTPLKQYFGLVAENKKLIAKGVSHVDIYGQSLLITDLKWQIKVMETTLAPIVALFMGAKVLMSQ